MDGAWINCKNCGYRHGAWISSCPKCGSANSSYKGTRGKAGLAFVKLSSNAAAQAHAEDILKTRQLSHWMTNGEKPYMAYTRYGGMGDVSQNAAITKNYLSSTGQSLASSQCNPLICEKLDLYKAIDSLESSMINDDLECCNDGHKHNILDKYHTNVSVGVAHDDYTLVLVQNFENNYIHFNKPIVKEDGKHIQLSGTFPTNKFEGIEIFYDNAPTPSVYEDNKARREYGLGQHVASVVEPWWMKQYMKPSDHILITSDSWSVNNNSIDVTFDISQALDKQGVYTIVMYLSDKDGNEFNVSNYSLLYGGNQRVAAIGSIIMNN